MKVTFGMLVEARGAFETVMTVEGLSPVDKMRLARVQRALNRECEPAEIARLALVKKYAEKGQARTGQATVPEFVLPPEFPEFMVEWNKYLAVEYDPAGLGVPLPCLRMSTAASSPKVLPAHLFALAWLLEDDLDAGQKPAAP